ncbi:MAG TPA: lactate racemase domain-containing protein [Candidatus Limiplasma sp.]|nr:lactate racemase domain-containing protein [Candidatus Limiplasma sp.]HRX08222.1 lactate racemase domain-containing protein [Candidatus Limiplasma sp.]
MQEFLYARTETGLSQTEIAQALETSLAGRTLRHVLIIPPDFTRYHSNAGLITNLYYHMLDARGCQVDILPALGTHMPVTREQAAVMFGDIPFERFLVHSWREDLVTLGTVPGDFLSDITEGLWCEPITAQINRLVMDPKYDLILSVGQVVPHEVIGMANHAKNLFVGVGGADMINKSHMVSAVYGMERIMGKDYTPVRRIIDYAFENFLTNRPVIFVLTVCTAPNNCIRTHGLFISPDRSCLEAAVRLSQEKNIDFVPHGLKKCVAYLDPDELQTTWLGNRCGDTGSQH